MSWKEFRTGLMELISVESDDDENDDAEDKMRLLEQGMQDVNVSSASPASLSYNKNNKIRNRNVNNTNNDVDDNDNNDNTFNTLSSHHHHHHRQNLKKKSRRKKSKNNSSQSTLSWLQNLLEVSSSEEDDDVDREEQSYDQMHNYYNNNNNNNNGDVELKTIVIDTGNNSHSSRSVRRNSNGIVLQHHRDANDSDSDDSSDSNENTDETIFFDFDFDSDGNEIEDSKDEHTFKKNGEKLKNTNRTRERLYDADKEYKKEFVLTDQHFEQMGIKDNRNPYERGANPQFHVLDVYIAFANTVVKNKAPKKKVNFQVQNDMDFWKWINEIVSSFSKYIHCELIFMIFCKKDNKIRRIVSSIHRAKKLRMVQKKYRHVDEGKWIFYHYKCSEEDKKKIFDFEYRKNNTEFNKWAFYLNFLLPDFLKIDNGGKKVFCSEEICHNLKETQSMYFGDLKPYKTDPYNLSQHLLNKTNITERCDEPTPKKTKKLHS